MTQTLTEFRRQIHHQGPQQKVRNSWGVYDYYKFYRKNKPQGHEYVLTESQYFAIIRKINQKLADRLLSYEPVEFPQSMGILEIRKKQNIDRIVDGKLVTAKPIDWDTTIKLWHEDAEAYAKKQLVRFNVDNTYRVIYDLSKAVFTNKYFYEFRINKEIKERLSRQLKGGDICVPYFITTEENNIKGLYDD